MWYGWPVVEWPPCQQAAGIVQDKPAKAGGRRWSLNTVAAVRAGADRMYIGPGQVEGSGCRRSRLAERALHATGWQVTTKEEGQIRDEADDGMGEGGG